MSNGSPLSVRHDIQDWWRLREIAARLGTTPSAAVRQLIQAAVPCPSARFAIRFAAEAVPAVVAAAVPPAAEPPAAEDDPAERDTLPPSAPPEWDDEPLSEDSTDRQLDLYGGMSLRRFAGE